MAVHSLERDPVDLARAKAGQRIGVEGEARGDLELRQPRFEEAAKLGLVEGVTFGDMDNCDGDFVPGILAGWVSVDPSKRHLLLPT